VRRVAEAAVAEAVAEALAAATLGEDEGNAPEGQERPKVVGSVAAASAENMEGADAALEEGAGGGEGMFLSGVASEGAPQAEAAVAAAAEVAAAHPIATLVASAKVVVPGAEEVLEQRPSSAQPHRSSMSWQTESSKGSRNQGDGRGGAAGAEGVQEAEAGGAGGDAADNAERVRETGAGGGEGDGDGKVDQVEEAIKSNWGSADLVVLDGGKSSRSSGQEEVGSSEEVQTGPDGDGKEENEADHGK
jgi:hypothetical protein